MSYRTIKRLLGETSLERKCRFLFGGALLLLITGSFYVYAMLNLRIVTDQYRDRARLLIGQDMMAMHLGIGRGKPEEVKTPEVQRLEQLSAEFKPADLRETQWKFIRANWQDEPLGPRSPSTPIEYDIIKMFPDVETAEAR